ncbi:MAG: hypothetical protein OK439_00075 [Thaumarchaeota archaeon]|nr:hypothetical protein [Nitrososphaerota archaeon]
MSFVTFRTTPFAIFQMKARKNTFGIFARSAKYRSKHPRAIVDAIAMISAAAKASVSKLVLFNVMIARKARRTARIAIARFTESPKTNFLMSILRRVTNRISSPDKIFVYVRAFQSTMLWLAGWKVIPAVKLLHYQSL